MDVVGIGRPYFDMLIRVKEMPQKDRSARLLEQSWQGGGKVPTALVALARLGVRTGFIDVVDNEPYGRFCLEDFKRHGVDTSHVVIDMKGETPFTVAISEELTNTRNLISSIGSVRELKPDELDWDYITSAKYLHLEYPTPTSVVAADWAREVGVKVVIDAEQYTPDMIEFIPKVNVFIASEFFYNGMFKDEKYEENCRKILNMGPEIVVFTFGSRGCLGIGPEGFFNIRLVKSM